MKTYTVYFLTPEIIWENVKATSKKDAIAKCSAESDSNTTPKVWHIAEEQKGRKTNERKS